VQHAKASLLARAQALGHVITEDPHLHVMADGKRIEPEHLSPTRRAFLLPAERSSIELRCRSFIPAHVLPASDDQRSLGICVSRLQLDGADVALETRRHSLSARMHSKAIRRGITGVGPTIALHCRGKLGSSSSIFAARAIIGQSAAVLSSPCLAERRSSKPRRILCREVRIVTVGVTIRVPSNSNLRRARSRSTNRDLDGRAC